MGTSTGAASTPPAELLEGRLLQNGWQVGTMIPRKANQTGGAFSCSYRVSKPSGQFAFLKAMDYSAALASSDPATALNQLTSAFLFERELLAECANQKMSRIVRAIDGGKLKVAGQTVEYLIFEEASGGDIRNYLDNHPQFDLVWRLTCIHNICVGAQQLHSAGIAHQDLKPSNVLHFPGVGEKLADLGRAWHRRKRSPHDNLNVAGAITYAPPELLYGYLDANESDRRFGSDFYLIGSMLIFLFFGVRASQILIDKLDPSHRPTNWQGSYEAVLPYLQHAFVDNLETIGRQFPDERLRAEIVEILRQMCDPDISVRGDRAQRSKFGSRFALHRFITRFDLLRGLAMLGRIHHR